MIDRDLDWVFKMGALFKRRRFLFVGGGGAPPAVVGAGVGAMQECVHAVQELKFDTTQ